MRIAWVVIVALWAGGSELLAAPSSNPKPNSAPASTSAPASKPSADVAAKLKQVERISNKLVDLFKVGKYADCMPLLEEILRIDPGNSTAYYNMACVHARLGQKDQAIADLNTAVDNGYADLRHMQKDEDLVCLHDVDGYKKLVARKDDILRKCGEALLASLRKKYGSEYICQLDADNRLVYVTNIDSHLLDEIKSTLALQSQALGKDLFPNRIEQYVTVLIPSMTAADWNSKWAQSPGYYSAGDHLLVARQAGMVLRHEFTHALHMADQEALGQEHPIWIVEGFATLEESSEIQDGHMIPQPNGRLNVLKRLVKDKGTIKFSEFCKLKQDTYVGKAMICYPQGRYMMMYLNEKGLLRKWYETYTANYKADPSGATAMEKVLGKPLAQIETDWLKWVSELKAPPLSLSANDPYMGVRVQAQTEGLMVTDVVAGSGADKAGIKSGDLLTKINGDNIVDPAELIRVVDGREVGDKVTIEYRRSGTYKTVAIFLQAMPKKLAARPSSSAGLATTTSAPATAPATQAAEVRKAA